MEKKEYRIRQLGKDEKSPLDLLLLADESIEALNKYVFDSEIYVLEQDGKVIAEYALLPLSESEAEIKNIAVAAEFQGQGIGKMLLKDAADRAKARGFKTLIVGTGDVSAPLRFYRKAGFEVFGVRKGFFVNNYPTPIYDDGKQLKDMVLLKKEL
jgi:ribosomal protein S18 acetylase RimI-like enzyme